jgi:hypothetical protein
MNRPLELKPLDAAEIPKALERAERYREHAEVEQAQSICHDVLLVEPDNQRAHILLLESLCDGFGKGSTVDFLQALEILPQLENPYDRAFYAGVICDHKAHALLADPDSAYLYDAYEYLCEAMSCYEKAEKLRPGDCSEARQRWNACARIISAHHLTPWPIEAAETDAMSSISVF